MNERGVVKATPRTASDGARLCLRHGVIVPMGGIPDLTTTTAAFAGECEHKRGADGDDDPNHRHLTDARHLRLLVGATLFEFSATSARALVITPGSCL
jgi:hypothetical protein